MRDWDIVDETIWPPENFHDRVVATGIPQFGPDYHRQYEYCRVYAVAYERLLRKVKLMMSWEPVPLVPYRDWSTYQDRDVIHIIDLLRILRSSVSDLTRPRKFAKRIEFRQEQAVQLDSISKCVMEFNDFGQVSLASSGEDLSETQALQHLEYDHYLSSIYIPKIADLFGGGFLDNFFGLHVTRGSLDLLFYIPSPSKSYFRSLS